ncbi:MAG: hypothetical protein ABIZ04_23880 [Opitutus sp.]
MLVTEDFSALGAGVTGAGVAATGVGAALGTEDAETEAGVVATLELATGEVLAGVLRFTGDGDDTVAEFAALLAEVVAV